MEGAVKEDVCPWECDGLDCDCLLLAHREPEVEGDGLRQRGKGIHERMGLLAVQIVQGEGVEQVGFGQRSVGYGWLKKHYAGDWW